MRTFQAHCKTLTLMDELLVGWCKQIPRLYPVPQGIRNSEVKRQKNGNSKCFSLTGQIALVMRTKKRPISTTTTQWDVSFQCYRNNIILNSNQQWPLKHGWQIFVERSHTIDTNLKKSHCFFGRQGGVRTQMLQHLLLCNTTLHIEWTDSDWTRNWAIMIQLQKNSPIKN